MTRRGAWAVTGIFCAFIALFFILNLIIPDRSFSEQENRMLSGRPSFSLRKLFSGDFTSDFESYVTDQFTFRDTWITLKARMEVLLGKSENNGVILCEGGVLIEPLQQPDGKLLETNTAAVNSLCANTDADVFLALIPDKAELYSSLLPSGVSNASQEDIIDGVYSGTDATAADVLSPLAAHADEYIFYRTDHHWTTLGAYYAYTALAETMGFEPTRLSELLPETVSDSFYGTTWSASGFSWVRPDSINVLVDGAGVSVTNYPSGTAVEGVVYDKSKLEVKDKYAFFFGGNTPLMTIDTGAEDKPTLLIIRDSYADSLTPFLFADYSAIHVIDLRYFRTSLAAYIAENEVDQVLIMYSLRNFCSDTNVFLAGR